MLLTSIRFWLLEGYHRLEERSTDPRPAQRRLCWLWPWLLQFSYPGQPFLVGKLRTDQQLGKYLQWPKRAYDRKRRLKLGPVRLLEIDWQALGKKEGSYQGVSSLLLVPVAEPGAHRNQVCIQTRRGRVCHPLQRDNWHHSGTLPRPRQLRRDPRHKQSLYPTVPVLEPSQRHRLQDVNGSSRQDAVYVLQAGKACQMENTRTGMVPKTTAAETQSWQTLAEPLLADRLWRGWNWRLWRLGFYWNERRPWLGRYDLVVPETGPWRIQRP